MSHERFVKSGWIPKIKTVDPVSGDHLSCTTKVVVQDKWLSTVGCWCVTRTFISRGLFHLVDKWALLAQYID